MRLNNIYASPAGRKTYAVEAGGQLLYLTFDGDRYLHAKLPGGALVLRGSHATGEAARFLQSRGHLRHLDTGPCPQPAHLAHQAWQCRQDGQAR